MEDQNQTNEGTKSETKKTDYLKPVDVIVNESGAAKDFLRKIYEVVDKFYDLFGRYKNLLMVVTVISIALAVYDMSFLAKMLMIGTLVMCAIHRIASRDENARQKTNQIIDNGKTSLFGLFKRKPKEVVVAADKPATPETKE